MSTKIKRYEFKGKRGIDDLLAEYAFAGMPEQGIGNSNSIEEYLDSQGWLRYIFDVPMTREAIAIEVERRKKENIEYIERLHRKGRFGEWFIIELELVDNPALDRPDIRLSSELPMKSYRMVFLDTFNETK